MKGTWPFFGPVLDSTPSLAINALTTDVIIDMDCDLPENKHLSRVLVVQVREGGGRWSCLISDCFAEPPVSLKAVDLFSGASTSARTESVV